MSEDEVIAFASSVDTKIASINAREARKAQQIESYMDTVPEMRGLTAYYHGKPGGTTLDYLEQSKWGIFTAINGDVPVMGLSFLWPTTVVYRFFMTVEEELREKRNPLYMVFFENAKYPGDKRMALVLRALKGEDEECLRVMASMLEKLRVGFVSHMYWEDVEMVEERMHRMENREEPKVPECTVM